VTKHKGIGCATDQADCEANVGMTNSLQGCRQHDGDPEAMVSRVFDVRRFTKEEVERGDAAGWRLWCGWFERASGLRWAWFRREESNDGSQ